MNVPPVGLMPAHEMLDLAAARPEGLSGLAQQFNQMMQAHPPEPAGHGTADGPSVVSHFVGQMDSALQHTFDNMRSFGERAPSMSFEELSAHHVQMTMELSMVQLQFTAGVSMAQSSKNGLQTLMKNQ